MSWRRTLLNAAVFVALVVLYAADGRRRTARDAELREAVSPFGADAAKIEAVTLERMGKKVELALRDGGWRMLEPVEAAADPGQMRTLLDLLAGQEAPARQRADGGDLEAFGLAKPAYSIRVKTAGGEREVVFGQESPVEGRVYARMRDGFEVFTISRELAEMAILPVNELRDRRLIPMNAAEADAFTVTFEGRTVTAAREGDAWKLTQPSPAAADAESVGDFLGAIQIARIEDFVETGTLEPAALGLDAPAAAAIFSRGTERHTLLVGHRRAGSEPPVYYASRAGSPGIFTVKQDLLTLLQIRPTDLRDRRAVMLAREEAASLDLEFGNSVTRLRKDAQGVWRFEGGDARPADAGFVEEILTRLLRIEVAEYIETQPTPDISGMDAPYVRIRVATADGTRSSGLETGRPHPTEGDRVFARRLGGGGPSEVFLIAADEPGHFFLGPDAFADKTLFGFATSSVRAFTIEANNQVLSFQREDDAWVAALRGGQEFFQIKPALAERFLTAVAALKFKKRLDPADEADAAMIAKSGLDKPNGTFAFFDAGSAELGRFTQGGFDQSRVFIRTGDGTVYATDRATYGAFVNALSALVQMK